MMKFSWSINLKSKLFGLVGIGVVLVLSVVAVGVFFYSRIETAKLLKDDVQRIVQKVLGTGIAEKTYLQFYTPDLRQHFNDMADDTGLHIEKLGK